MHYLLFDTLANPVVFISAIILLVIGISLIAFFVVKRPILEQWQKDEAEKSELGGFTHAMAEKFYNDCKEKKLANIDTAVNKQKILLLAQSAYPDITDIASVYEKMFETGRDMVESENNAKRQAEKDARVARDLDAEQIKHRRTKDIAGMKNRDKRIFMLGEVAEKLIQKKNTLFESFKASMAMGTAMAAATSEKEMGWGVTAGLASGIAGPMIGAAVASDIMQSDRAIRERNELRKQYYNALATEQIGSSFDDYTALLRNISKINEEIDGTRIKLTDETHPQDELLSALVVADEPRCHRTESGTVIVSVTVSATLEYAIEGVPQTVIDGTVFADIFAGDKLVGEAYLPLPLYGLTKDEQGKLEGICIASVESKTKLTAKLKPGNLWIIEL